jgi:hypothetical protein
MATQAHILIFVIKVLMKKPAYNLLKINKLSSRDYLSSGFQEYSQLDDLKDVFVKYLQEQHCVPGASFIIRLHDGYFRHGY